MDSFVSLLILIYVIILKINYSVFELSFLTTFIYWGGSILKKPCISHIHCTTQLGCNVELSVLTFISLELSYSVRLWTFIISYNTWRASILHIVASNTESRFKIPKTITCILFCQQMIHQNKKFYMHNKHLARNTKYYSSFIIRK